MRIVVAGMVAGVPGQGGAAWAVLQYVLGLQQLGHDVTLLEPVDAAALVPAAAPLPDTVSARYLTHVIDAFGLRGRAALIDLVRRDAYGLSMLEISRRLRGAQLLINMAGMLPLDDDSSRIPARIYLDLDPAFTQLWQAVEGLDMRFAGHTHYATVGLSLGEADCPVPTCGLAWIPTLQPVVLAHWPVQPPPVAGKLTTVANWRGYGSVRHAGVLYGQKAHAVRELIDLPARTEQPIAIALAIHPDEKRDIEALRAHGWRLLDPAAETATPEDYQRFIQRSWGELGIAKSGYVHSRCGWFSDRSACYLASGRPVIAQETGYSSWLPTGEGLLPFTSTNDALAAIEEVRARYGCHRAAAREIARECFDSERVLTRLLDRVGGAA